MTSRSGAARAGRTIAQYVHSGIGGAFEVSGAPAMTVTVDPELRTSGPAREPLQANGLPTSACSNE